MAELAAKPPKRQTHCSAPGCTSGYVSARKKGAKASTFAAPDDEEMLRTWQRAIPQRRQAVGQIISVLRTALRRALHCAALHSHTEWARDEDRTRPATLNRRRSTVVLSQHTGLPVQKTAAKKDSQGLLQERYLERETKRTMAKLLRLKIPVRTTKHWTTNRLATSAP